VIPLLGTRSLVNGLAKDFRLNTTASYRAWFNERQVNIWNVLNCTVRLINPISLYQMGYDEIIDQIVKNIFAHVILIEVFVKQNIISSSYHLIIFYHS
jgi:hypothetical protein